MLPVGILRDMLDRELERNLAMKVEDGETADTFIVSGRGTLHITILIENMEGYEFMVGPPKVIQQEGERQSDGAVRGKFPIKFLLLLKYNVKHRPWLISVVEFWETDMVFCERWQRHGVICRIFGSPLWSAIDNIENNCIWCH
ncbi:unnamed protein product [Trifolium pratense]|uniref:Uncharacterized protein n=1 Tax=Trifolium pratense TaxID=57577 RepID=A0ACB0LXU5_TRIPR|nr:unnamed protein product [Trifolium pratense]